MCPPLEHDPVEMEQDAAVGVFRTLGTLAVLSGVRWIAAAAAFILLYASLYSNQIAPGVYYSGILFVVAVLCRVLQIRIIARAVDRAVARRNAHRRITIIVLLLIIMAPFIWALTQMPWSWKIFTLGVAVPAGCIVLVGAMWFVESYFRSRSYAAAQAVTQDDVNE